MRLSSALVFPHPESSRAPGTAQWLSDLDHHHICVPVDRSTPVDYSPPRTSVRDGRAQRIDAVSIHGYPAHGIKRRMIDLRVGGFASKPARPLQVQRRKHHFPDLRYAVRGLHVRRYPKCRFCYSCRRSRTKEKEGNIM